MTAPSTHVHVVCSTCVGERENAEAVGRSFTDRRNLPLPPFIAVTDVPKKDQEFLDEEQYCCLCGAQSIQYSVFLLDRMYARYNGEHWCVEDL
jgi:hypothetical protein